MTVHRDTLDVPMTVHRDTLDVPMTVHRDTFPCNKPTRCTNFSNLFSKETLHVSDSSSVHHQEFFIVNTTIVYVIQVCWQLASRIRMESSSILILFASCQQTCMTYTIAVFTVKNYWWWTEKLSETCRVSFQNKFEKLVHLFWWGSLRERGHWGYQEVDGRIILRWTFRKLEGVVGTGWSWHRIGTGGGHLWVRWWTFGFHKCREFLD